jgi:hypothetical protein
MKYYITVFYKDGTVSHDQTYDYGRTPARVLADAKKTYPNASDVTVTTKAPSARQHNPMTLRGAKRRARARARNPLRKIPLKFYLVKATQGGRATYLTARNEFSGRAANAKHFRDVRSAVSRAKTMLNSYPHLKRFRVDIVSKTE